MSSRASSSTVTTRSADEALRAYCEHFAARRADELVALFSAHALIEIPLLEHHVRGNEVAPTLEQILSGLNTCEVQLHHVASAGDTAIGEGHLSAQTENGPLVFDFAVVVEVNDSGQIVRLSEYFDTEPIKPLD